MDNLKEMLFSIEIYKEDGEMYMYIAQEGDTGCKYRVENSSQVAEYIENFIDDNQ